MADTRLYLVCCFQTKYQPKEVYKYDLVSGMVNANNLLFGNYSRMLIMAYVNVKSAF